MSGVVDLLVRLLGENEGAVRAVRQVGEEVDKTDRKVQDSTSRMQQWASALGSSGIGGLLGGGGIVGVVSGGINAAVAAANAVNQMMNVQGRLSDATTRLGLPTSGADLAQSILDTGNLQAKAEGASLGRTLRTVGDVITGKGGFFNFSGQDYESQRKSMDLFKTQVLQNPELALSALRSGAFGEQTPQFQKVYSDWATRAMKSPEFIKGATAGNTINNTSNVNVNVTSGVGDPRQIGADVYSALDSYQRLNTHLQAPYPATGYMGR